MLLYENTQLIIDQRVPFAVCATQGIQPVADMLITIGQSVLLTSEINYALTDPNGFLGARLTAANGGPITVGGIPVDSSKLASLLGTNIFSRFKTVVDAFWAKLEQMKSWKGSTLWAYDPTMFQVVSGIVQVNDTVFQAYADANFRFYSRSQADIDLFTQFQATADSITTLNNLMNKIDSYRMLTNVSNGNALTKTMSFDKKMLSDYLRAH